MMRKLICFSIGALLFLTGAMYRVSADDVDRPGRAVADQAPASNPSEAKTTETVTETDLLKAKSQGLISIQAEGRGDGRMTVSITNRTKRRLRVVLPPGLIAKSATGQFGGIGGMGGGMGGMGGRGGTMGGTGSLKRSAGTMPSIMGVMMLSRMIMYFGGDPDSWDKRSLMIGMMDGMGGGMRSVLPTELPSTVLESGQTRHLPTRLVVLGPPNPQEEVKLPEKGEPLQLGDIADINDNPRVQKALRRLAADAVSRSIARLVMWHLTAGLDWDTLAQLSSGWANPYELTLAKDFVDHLDNLPPGETGRVLFEVDWKDAASAALAIELRTVLRRKVVLGLMTELGIPPRPEGPAIALRVLVSAHEPRVLVYGSDATGTEWRPMGMFTLTEHEDSEKLDLEHLADAIAEGTLNRLVRVELSKGVEDKGEIHYQLRVDNASPLVLNGVAAVGATSGPDSTPRVLSGISLSPRRSMTLPASEEVVRSLGLKQGIKLIALDLSGL
jgi:hypothetical protein